MHDDLQHDLPTRSGHAMPAEQPLVKNSKASLAADLVLSFQQEWYGGDLPKPERTKGVTSIAKLDCHWQI